MITPYLQAFIGALGFLTRTPLPSKWFKTNQSVSSTAWAFPCVGALIGLIASFIFLVFHSLGLGNLIPSFLAIITTVYITGALHEDGLGDVCDGFYSKATPKERLIVMKDSHIGTYAGLALISSIIFRILIIARLAEFGTIYIFCSLITLEAISRGFMVWFWGLLPLARTGGTADSAGSITKRDRYSALTISFFIAFIFICLPLSLLAFVNACLFGLIASLVFSKLCLHKINGFTGDTLGACQQLTWAASAIGIIIGVHFS